LALSVFNLSDADAADIFAEISRGVDKWLWFVEAHLQAEDSVTHGRVVIWLTAGP
jgi:hypothetical protein